MGTVGGEETRSRDERCFGQGAEVDNAVMPRRGAYGKVVNTK